MPNYTFDHLHHETTDVTAAVDFYKRVLGATAGEPFERGGATWVEVHIGPVQVTVTVTRAGQTLLTVEEFKVDR